MYQLNCKHCGEVNAVDSFLAAAERNCTHCGQPIMGAPATRASTDRPWEKQEELPPELGAGNRNIMVQAVSYMNFIFGALHLTCGLFLNVIAGLFKTEAGAQAAAQKGLTGEQLANAAVMASYFSMGL